MAEFSVDGMDGLMLSMQEIAELPESLVDEILILQADYLAGELQERCLSYGASKGTLAKSIKRGKPKRAKNGCRQVVVAPRGRRKHTTKDGKVLWRTNAEIGFLRNYGTRHMKALPFWSDTIELESRTLDRIAAEVRDRWLQSKEL